MKNKERGRVPRGTILRKPITGMTTESRTLDIFKKNTLQVLLKSTIIPFRWLRTCFRCFFCYEMFQDADTLKTHQEIHTLQDKHVMMKVFCDPVVTVDVSEIVCRMCLAEMEDIFQLVNHLTTVHDMEFDEEVGINMAPIVLDTGPKCVFCSMSFNNFNSLIIHMDRHHKNCFRSFCQTCRKNFTSTRDFCGHVQKQLLGDQLKCTQCEEFVNVGVLRSHMSKVHNMKYKCLVCLEFFTSHYKRSNHMADYHNRRTRVKCAHCSRSFIFRSILLRHMRENHLKEKNVVCEICGWRTYGKTQLELHMAKHDNVKHVRCPECDKAFKTKRYMKKHLVKVHQNVN